MLQAATSLALDVQAMAQLSRWLALPADARAGLLAELASTDAALHARVVSLAAACGSAGQSADNSASQALAAPLLQASRSWLTPGLQAGAVLAGWRLLRELGRGGMSVVWLAERADGSLKRQVAIKLPLAAHLSDQLSERFARERDVLAQLAHPHIARLYDAGVGASGQPYIALEYVVGQPITQFADEHHLDVRQRLQLFQQVLAAVDHAHRHLVVHRDLKPANILVDDEGQVKLLDFGIAKLLGLPANAAALTLDAHAVMTPRYAAPEQVAGGAITTSTDVYAAGVVLYELLTGRLPLGSQDASLAGLAQAVLHDAPQPPSQAAIDPVLRRKLAGDIDTVLLKALRKDPAQRYASVERLSEDLRRVLAHEPVLARRVSLGHRLGLLIQRHRLASAVTGIASLAMLAMAGTLLMQYQSSLAQRARGDAVRDFMFQMVSDAEPDETSQDGLVTGQQMVDAARQRAQNEFQQQPRLRGEILGELGRIDMRLGRDTLARQTLEQAVQLLGQHGTRSDPALNKARAHLAYLLPQAEGARAQALASAAVADCTNGSVDCLKAQAYGHGVLRDLAGRRGNHDLALTEARSAVQAMSRAFGENDPNHVIALESQAVIARNAGRLADAQVAIDRAFTVAQHATLRAAGRLGLERTRALLALDLGRYQHAAETFKALGQRAHTPRDRLVLARLEAQAYLGLGLGEAALEAAQRALAEDSGGSTSQLQRLLAQQTLARAWTLLGQPTLARRQLGSVEAALQSQGSAKNSQELVRNRRLTAEAMLVAGQWQEAQQQLAALLEQHAQASPGMAVDHGLAADLAGCLARFQNDQALALQHHADAARHYRAQLPADHMLLARNAVLQALAAQRSRPGPESTVRLLEAADRYRSRLPPQSAWLDLLHPSRLTADTAGPPGLVAVLL